MYVDFHNFTGYLKRNFLLLVLSIAVLFSITTVLCGTLNESMKKLKANFEQSETSSTSSEENVSSKKSQERLKSVTATQVLGRYVYRESFFPPNS